MGGGQVVLETKTEIHWDIHAQLPRHRSGLVSDGGNPVMVDMVSIVMVDEIPRVAMPDDKNVVKGVGKG